MPLRSWPHSWWKWSIGFHKNRSASAVKTSPPGISSGSATTSSAGRLISTSASSTS